MSPWRCPFRRCRHFAPTNLTVRAHLEPDAVNRALEVAVGSSEYYQTGRIQLDGTEASRTISLEVRNLPCGGRDVRRSLINSGGPRAIRCIQAGERPRVRRDSVEP
jgi:hypothetical protein